MAIFVRETFRGLSVIRLQAGHFVARICPEMGGNLIQFSNTRLGADALRMPPDAQTLRDNPNVYGVPFLFPPNRIHGGTYTFQGRKYTFPINEPDRNNFIHGFLSSTPMEVVHRHADERSASVTLRYTATADAPYITFPHAFTAELTYTLGAKTGLVQTVTVTNDSDQDMPFGLGFHTAFQTPPCEGGDCRMFISLGREWLLEHPSVRPNGQYAQDTPVQRALTGKGLAPNAQLVSGLFEQAGCAARVRDERRGVEVIYEVDKGYRFWMLWNQAPGSGFFCAEPQTWAVDAPNSPLPSEQSGFDAIAPGDSRTLTSHLTIRKIED